MSNLSKEEALAKIKELEGYIQGFDEKVGYKNDIIFLLSVEEYEKYKKRIPCENCWWRLRSPGNYQRLVAVVDNGGSACYYGHGVDNDDDCVRPALKYSNLKISKSKKGEDHFMFGEVCWKILDEEAEIAIAELPIGFQKFDNYSNKYESSKIRRWLLDWLKQAEE